MSFIVVASRDLPGMWYVQMDKMYFIPAKLDYATKAEKYFTTPEAAQALADELNERGYDNRQYPNGPYIAWVSSRNSGWDVWHGPSDRIDCSFKTELAARDYAAVKNNDLKWVSP